MSPYCDRPLIKIDHYGEMLEGCIHCNRWGPPRRQSAVTWMRSNLRRPRVENRSRKAGLRTFWSESLVTSEKVIPPARERAMGSNSSMRFLTAICKFWIVAAIAQYYHRPNNPGVSPTHQDDHYPQKNDERAAPQPRSLAGR